MTRFPIGIYGVKDAAHLARLQEDGFDSFQTYDRDVEKLAALAKEARRLGMRMVVFPDKARLGDRKVTRSWPIDAWYLFDEPDVAKISSGTLQEISNQTSQWDPLRLQTFVIGQGSAAERFGKVADIVMMDWYPVPHRKTDSVADEIDLVTAALPTGKPFWMVVQAYDWADEITDPEKLKKGLRFPNRSEIRFMSYLSVMHGAKGLFYFELGKKGRTLFDYPELWQAVSEVAREMRSMRPIFEGGVLVPTPFEPVRGGLEARCWKFRGRRYLVLANRSEVESVEVPAVVLGPEWRPLYETRRNLKEKLPQEGGQFLLGPLKVLVLES